MASAFNLTAQINLQGPANLKPVVAQIKRSLSSITTDINIKFDSKASKNVDALTNKLSVLNRVLIESSRNSQTLATSLSSLSGSINQLNGITKVNANISKTSQSMTSTAQAVSVATTEMQEFGKQSALAIRRFAAFSLVTSGVFSLINAINAGAKAFVEFDAQIIKLRQTTGAGSVAIKDLESEITTLAVNLGVSSEKLAQVAIVLAQAGLSANQTKEALSALAKTELTPSFEDITQTTEGAIAAMRQFNIETGDLEKALGSINAVAAAFAVESGDIVAAIQRAGGAFAASSRGVSEGLDALNEFIAVFTSVRATTRESAETIATGLRTIFTRIQRGSTIDFLREFNVELTDLDGKFVGPFEAVRRLSEVLNSLDPRDLRFSQIVEELGGFRQIGKVIPLIQQFATAQDALNVAQRGQGSLAQAQAVAQLSLANQIAKVREEFLALIRAVGQSQTFQALFKTVLGLTSGLIKLAGVIKPILPLLAILGAVKGASALTQFAGGFAGGIKRSGGNTTTTSNSASSSLVTSPSSTTGTQSSSSDRNTTAIIDNTSSIKSLIISVQNLTQSINNRNSGSSTLSSGGQVKPLTFSTGGFVPGRGRGDKVPALLEPGEVVMNRNAVNKYGAGNLVEMNKSRSTKGIARGARSRFKELSSEELSQLSTEDMISYAKAQAEDIFTTAGAGMATSSKFIPVPKERITPELESSLTTYLGQRGFWQEVVSPFGQPNISVSKAQSRLSREQALEQQTTRMADEVAARGQQWTSIRDGSSIDNYLLGALKDPIASDYRTVRGGGSLSKTFHSTRLRKAVNEALDSYDDFDYSPGNIDKLVSGFAAKTFAYGGVVQKFKEGGMTKELQKQMIEAGGYEKFIQQNMLPKDPDLYEFGLVGLRSGTKSASNTPVDRELGNGKKARIHIGFLQSANDPNFAANIEEDINKSLQKTIVKTAGIFGQDIDASISSQTKDQILEGAVLSSAVGSVFESALQMIGAPYIDKIEAIKSIDFPFGLGSSSKLFGSNFPSNIPTDATRTIAGSGKGVSDFLGQINRFVGAVDSGKFTDKLEPLPTTQALSAREMADALVRSAKSNPDNISRINDVLQRSSIPGIIRKQNIKRTDSLVDSLARSPETIKMLEAAGFGPAYQASGGLIKKLKIGGQVYDTIKKAYGGSIDKIPISTIKQLSKKLNVDIIKNDDNTYDIFDSVYGKTFYSSLNSKDLYSILSSKYGVNPDMLELQSKAMGGSIGKTVPAMVSNGEAFVPPETAKRIGYAKLNRMNQADRNGMKGYSGGGISIFKGAGSGTSDSIGPVGLPEGGYVIRAKATKALGFSRGGGVGVTRLASGGFAENPVFAKALRMMAEEMKNGASAMVAAREAAKSIEFALPEAAKFLNQAADNFAKTGDITTFGSSDNSKNVLSNSFSSSGDVTAAIEALAIETQNGADVLALFTEQAKQSGVSLQKFQLDLKQQLADRALAIQSDRKNIRQDLSKQLLRGKVSDLSNPDVVSSIRDSLTSQITALSGSGTDPNAIKATVDQLIIDLGDSSKTFDDLKQSSTLLTKAFDVSTDRASALEAAQAEFSDQLGGLTDAVRVTIDELNAIDYKKSGQAAADFGFIGNRRPAQALAFKNSNFGGGLLATAKSFQQSAFLDKLPVIGKRLGGLGEILEDLPGPIGSAVKAIGGLPGAFAAVASMIGSEVIPQLAKALNMGDSETMAGIGGALAQGGSMAASLGTLGNQLAGPIGGMIGTIGGAVAGLIKGFSDGFRTKALENSLSRLTTQTEKVTKAFEYLSKVDNEENVANAQKEVVKLQENMADFKTKSGRSLDERAVDAGYYGILAGAGAMIAGTAMMIAGAGASATGVGAAAGIPLMTAGAGVATYGAAAAGIGGAAYGALKAPDDLDDEALQALLQTAETFIDGLNKLAERKINLKSLEDISAVINGYTTANKDIDAQVKTGLPEAEARIKRAEVNRRLGENSTAVQQAQQGALLNAGVDANSADGMQIMEREAMLAAEAAAMAELKRQYGDNNALIRRKMMGEEALIQRGFELLGIQEYQSSVAARLAIVTKQVAIETESLIDVYTKVLAGIQAFNSDIANSQISMEQSVGVLTGNASMGRVDRRNEEVLRNPRGYDDASFNRALDSVAALAGGGDNATRLTGAIRGRKALEENLPRLLRNTSSKDVDKVDRELRQILDNAQIDPETARSLADQVREAISKETSGRQGKSFDELAQEFSALQDIIRSTEKAQQVGIALEEAKNNALEQVNRNLDQFGSLMQKSGEWARKATEIMLQGALELDRVLGKGLSLDRLNEPFNAEIQAMTAGLNGGIGTTDPVTIAENIRNSRTQEVELRKQEQSLLNDGVALDAPALEAVKLAQTELARASRDSYAALEKLATSGANAANVLSKIEERRQIGKNAASFLERVFTQTGEEAFNMVRSFDAFQDAMNGTLNFGNQRERQMAFEGMNSLLPMLSQSVSGKVQARMLEQMLRGNGINDLNRELIPALGDQPALTYQNILDQLSNPELDPATQALIKTYNQLITIQEQAATQLSNLNAEAAKNVVLENIRDILTQLRDRLPAIFTEAVNTPPANPAAANPRPQTVAGNPGAAALSPTRGALIPASTPASAPAVNAGTVQIQANNAAVQANQSPQINGPGFAANNQPQPLLGANNLENVNMPALDQIAVAIPLLDNQLLNLINAFGLLNTNIVTLKDIIGALAKSKQDTSTGGNNSSSNTFGQQVTAFGVSITSFGASVTNFGSSIKNFTSYVERLEKIRFPEKITMGGSYTLDVRVSGAAAFEALETKTKQIIDTEISNKLDELQQKIAKATGFVFDTNRRTP
jgi:TP901 family phage tail tape measure protein